MNRFEFERGAHKVFNLDKRVTRGVRFPVRARKPDFHLVPVRFGGCERVVSVADGKQEVGNLAVVFKLYFVRRERVKFSSTAAVSGTRQPLTCPPFILRFVSYKSSSFSRFS